MIPKKGKAMFKNMKEHPRNSWASRLKYLSNFVGENRASSGLSYE